MNTDLNWVFMYYNHDTKKYWFVISSAVVSKNTVKICKAGDIKAPKCDVIYWMLLWQLVRIQFLNVS